MTVRFVGADAAAATIPDGATVAADGFTLLGVADEVYEAVEQRFLSTGSPANITLVTATGHSANGGGSDRFAHDGLLGRVIGSHWGLQPNVSRFLKQNRTQAICLPQGQITSLYRAIAARRPGILTRIGIGTFVDPLNGGGRMNEAAADAPDYVTDLTIDGERYLMYRSFPINIGIIRATTVDEDGNCSLEEEAVTLDQLGIAQAVHASGGTVIVQAKNRVPRGAIPPRQVTIPGHLVDLAVVTSDADRYHRQTHGALFDERLVTSGPAPVPGGEALEADRLSIGRIAVRDLEPGQVINIGTGIPGDVVGNAIAERGLVGDVIVTVEAGTVGGLPLGQRDFGSAIHPTAIVSHAHQFDFYGGGGLDRTFMGAGQVDQYGNVNVSKLGERVIGCGGFIDITQSTRRITFCFLLGGKHPKFVPDVSQITFSAKTALEQGQVVEYVTERAVFCLKPDGLHLVSVVDGYDLQSDVLDLIPFPVVIDVDVDPTPTVKNKDMTHA